MSLSKQVSCALHLCKLLLYSVASLSFHLGGSFVSLMDMGQQILGHGLGGTLTPIW